MTRACRTGRDRAALDRAEHPLGFRSGRLFTGERNDQELPKLTIVRAWKRARGDVFTPEVVATPLAGTPYDLNHAAVSAWLRGGVPAVEV